MDRYEIVKSLGRGNFGTVSVVHRRSDTKPFVLKRIHVRGLNTDQRDAAIHEAQLLSTLRHDCIVGYVDSFLDGDDMCIVMEYCEGGDLGQMIQFEKERRHHTQRKSKKNSRQSSATSSSSSSSSSSSNTGPFTEEQILDWFAQLGLGLHYMHSHHILHRDLKSQNVFLTGSQKEFLKIGDLGISKVLNSEMDFAKTVIGTPYYLSPEICEGQQYAKKSDIWSIGCILYELCTLSHPFQGKTLPSLLLNILKGTYIPIPSTYSPGLHSLIASLLQMKPSKRPSITQILQMDIIKSYVIKHRARIAACHIEGESHILPHIPIELGAVDEAVEEEEEEEENEDAPSSSPAMNDSRGLREILLKQQADYDQIWNEWAEDKGVDTVNEEVPLLERQMSEPTRDGVVKERRRSSIRPTPKVRRDSDVGMALHHSPQKKPMRPRRDSDVGTSARSISPQKQRRDSDALAELLGRPRRDSESQPKGRRSSSSQPTTDRRRPSAEKSRLSPPPPAQPITPINPPQELKLDVVSPSIPSARAASPTPFSPLKRRPSNHKSSKSSSALPAHPHPSQSPAGTRPDPSHPMSHMQLDKRKKRVNASSAASAASRRRSEEPSRPMSENTILANMKARNVDATPPPVASTSSSSSSRSLAATIVASPSILPSSDRDISPSASPSPSNAPPDLKSPLQLLMADENQRKLKAKLFRQERAAKKKAETEAIKEQMLRHKKALQAVRKRAPIIKPEHRESTDPSIAISSSSPPAAPSSSDAKQNDIKQQDDIITPPIKPWKVKRNNSHVDKSSDKSTSSSDKSSDKHASREQKQQSIREFISQQKRKIAKKPEFELVLPSSYHDSSHDTTSTSTSTSTSVPPSNPTLSSAASAPPLSSRGDAPIRNTSGTMQSRLGSRIQHERETCQQVFGADLFAKLYSFLRKYNSPMGPVSPPTAVAGNEDYEEIKDWLTPQQLPYLLHVHKLIYCEDLMFS